MKQKRRLITGIFSLLLFASLLNLGPKVAEAATTFVALQTNQSSASTSRITTKSSLSYVVNNVGSKPVYFNIFRNGVLHSSGLTVQPGKVINPGAATVKSGEYSLRIYCGSREKPQSSGCQAKGTITGN
ncbi:hypothetical protein [Pseudobacillus badius]|uniref:hypothetical protein n=1 Tax=Bacillus badius TaxID=1455 RepID=UPI0007B327C0|nr:hypothetical protein [Bacillus badius]KZR58725.1 hypothetical protein A3781_15535 [Bacillus badius]